VVFDLKGIDRNAALSFFYGDPFPIDLDLAELPAGNSVVGILLDGRVEQREVARHVAGKFSLNGCDNELLSLGVGRLRAVDGDSANLRDGQSDAAKACREQKLNRA
jgi:hypothetical protein